MDDANDSFLHHAREVLSVLVDIQLHRDEPATTPPNTTELVQRARPKHFCLEVILDRGLFHSLRCAEPSFGAESASISFILTQCPRAVPFAAVATDSLMPLLRTGRGPFAVELQRIMYPQHVGQDHPDIKRPVLNLKPTEPPFDQDNFDPSLVGLRTLLLNVWLC
ncbi:hypothetical protein PWT90_07805 [Aphanocladium album]|nr:hypothetical protein PWT90_07805 [Aphanocladium album]